MQLQAMTAAWVDAASKGLCFDSGSWAQGAAAAPGEAFRRRLLHHSSLLHGLALQFLRSDWDLGNIVPHDRSRLPAWVRSARGERERERALGGVGGAPGLARPVERRRRDRSGQKCHDMQLLPADGGLRPIPLPQDALYCPGFHPSPKDHVMLRGSLQAKRRYFRASPIPVLGTLSRLEAQALASATLPLSKPGSRRRPLTDESRGPLQAIFSPSHGEPAGCAVCPRCSPLEPPCGRS